MSKIQDVPFITKVIDTLSDELKSGLYDLIDGQVKTPVFRSLVNNDYAITEANDKGKVQFVTLETLRGNYTGYLAYNSVYCVLIAFKGNTQALDMLNINVAKHTFAFVNESLSILELRVELEDCKEGVTPTDLGVTNNNIHLAKGTKQIGEGVNFKTINGASIMGDGNIAVSESGTLPIDETLSTTSENALMNKTITNALGTKLALPTTAPATRKVVTIDTNGKQDNIDPTKLTILMANIVDSQGNKRFVEGNIEKSGANTQIEKIYGKWSLSGTHLLLVFCFNHLANETLGNGAWMAYAQLLPSYILNKIKPISGDIVGIFPYYRGTSNTSSYISLVKNNTGLVLVYYGNSYTPTEDEISRVQIDLLIDSD